MARVLLLPVQHDHLKFKVNDWHFMEEITCQRLVDEPRDVRFAVANQQLRQFRVPGVGELDGQR